MVESEIELEIVPSRKIPKTLSGIETTAFIAVFEDAGAGKYLKPYQGLKQAEIKKFMAAHKPENT